MSLKDIIGQDRALRILLGTLRKEKVPSAMLFSGDNGIGKKLAAINYAKAINCHNSLDYDSCDSCLSCKKIDSGTHPDILIITLDNVEDVLSLKKWDDKNYDEDGIRYEYPIEAIRKIEALLCMSPLEGKKKVVIIDDADMMNNFAANAFLKTLEEPPSDSLILLVSSNPDNLPDTIRSRCMNVKFYPLPAIRCKEVILKNTNIDNKDINLILNFSMGRPGLALSMNFKEDNDWFIRLLNNMIKGHAKEMWEDKDEIKSWLNMALVFLRDMAVRLKLGDKSSELLILPEFVVNSSILEAQRLKLELILDAYYKMQQLKGLLDFNLNKKITWNYVASIMRTLMVHNP